MNDVRIPIFKTGFLAIAVVCVLFIGAKMVTNNKQQPLLGKTGPFGSDVTAQSSHKEPRKVSEQLSAIDSSDDGRLYIYIMHDPDPRTFPAGLSKDDHFTSFFTGHEWAALFFDLLRCPRPVSDDTTELYGAKFSAALPSYTLLGRISDMYIYVCYKPEEVRYLREECLRVQRSSSTQKAQEGLGKLVQACDEALKKGSGLLFVPD